MVAPPDTTKPAFSSAKLEGQNPGTAFQATLGDNLDFSGTVTDNVGLSKITIMVTNPKVTNHQAGTFNVTGTSQSLSSYDFDTSNATYAGVTGRYYVSLYAKDSSGNEDYKQWIFDVVAPPDTQNPTITNLTASPSTLNQGSQLTIGWSASDNVGVTHLGAYLYQGSTAVDTRSYYSGGTADGQLDANSHVLTNDGNHTWTVPSNLPPRSDYRIKLVAWDAAQNNSGVNYTNFFIVQPQVPTNTPAFNQPFITDAQLVNANSMTADQIRAFLAARGSYFAQARLDVDEVSFDAAQVVYDASQDYQINPQVLLVTLQKESSGITRSTRPSDGTLRFLMGCVSPTTARAQIACAAERFRSYHDSLTNSGSTVSGWQVGVVKTTQDGVVVTPATKAVAGQFTYTPYAGAQWGGDQPSVGGVYLFDSIWNAFGFSDPTNADNTPPTVQFVAPLTGSFTIGDSVTIRGSASDSSDISHVQIELYKGGTAPSQRIGTISPGNIGDGNRTEYVWSIQPALNGRLLDGDDYKVKWVAWDNSPNHNPNAAYSEWISIRPATTNQATFSPPWTPSEFQYYSGRSFFYDQDHLGADIQLSEGTPIRAGVNGTIKYYSSATDYGNLVVAIEVDLGTPRSFTNGYGQTVTTSKALWILGHLRSSSGRNGTGQTLSWTPGDIVAPHDIIGYVEHDGENGEGAEHLHLGLRLQSATQAQSTDGSFWLRGHEGTSDMGQWFADPIAVLGLTAGVPATPSGLFARSNEPGTILVDWNHVTGANDYIVYRGETANGPWTQIYRGAETQYPDSNVPTPHLVQGQDYFYRVVAANSYGDSASTTPFGPVQLLVPPNSPTGINIVTSNEMHSNTITWNPTSDASFVVQRSPFDDFREVSEFTTTTNQYVDAGEDLLSDISYNYRVIQVNNDIRSLPSTGAGATILSDQRVPAVEVEIVTFQPHQVPDVTKAYEWNWSTEHWVEFDLNQSLDPSRPTIMLTHGWNDRLNINDSLANWDDTKPLPADAEYMEVFARDFRQDRPNYADYRILAVDWHGGATTNQFGSDPNGLPNAFLDAASGVIAIPPPTTLPQATLDAICAVAVDAERSANNGIYQGRELARKLNEAGIQPANLMLIGHSNGAGFMASLARELHRLVGQRVDELVALDAPYLTTAYSEVVEAASSVNRINNYYIPIIQSDTEVLFDPSLGFGGVMREQGTTIRNFELDASVSSQLTGGQIAHSAVPLRYAMTADGRHHDWGFQTSDFATQQCNLLDDAAACTLAETWLRKESTTVIGNGTFGAAGSFMKREINDKLAFVLESFSRFPKELFCEAIDLLSIVKNSTSIGGVNSNLVVPRLSSRSPSVDFQAASPTLASFDLVIPENANFLTFQLTVLDPGNNDFLQIAVGDQLVDEIALSTSTAGVTSTESFWIADFAGQDTTIHFLMPSATSSDANFDVSNIKIEFGQTMVADTLVDYGSNNEYFFDTTTRFYWYDPAEFVGMSRQEVDVIVQQSSIWNWATSAQVDELVGKASAGGSDLDSAMGTQQFTLITNGGYRWIGYYESTIQPDGWLVQTGANRSSITDSGFQNYVASWNPGAWLVSTVDPLSTAPAVSSLSPPDNATGVAVGTNLVLTFNEDIQKGVGNILLKRFADNSVVETIAVDSAAVTVSGAMVTIDPSVTLAEATGYYVEVATGAFEDLSGNDFGGISGATTWDFTTIEALSEDFGDAPAPYWTSAVDNGARHSATGPTLGASRDSESDGQPTANADGDGADEDGVIFGTIQVGQLDATVTVNVQNAANGAKLDAWIDFNGDGSWGGPGEQVFDSVSVTTGDNSLEFDVPSWAADGNAVARFRLSMAGDLGVGGVAADGEVEDYQLIINPPHVSLGAFSNPSQIGSMTGHWKNSDSVFTVDMDDDGDVDILSGGMAWFDNQGAGQFTKREIVNSPGAGDFAFAADMDGDSDIDLVSAGIGPNDTTVAWYENNGSQTFTEHVVSTPPTTNAWSATGADLDSDGDMDILVALGSGITWYENDGNQEFTEKVIGEGAWSLFPVDLDRDGHLDVLAAEYGRVVWYVNDGNQNFAKRTILTGGQPFKSPFGADLDSDGDMDVLVPCHSKLVWLQNNGDEEFTERVLSIYDPFFLQPTSAFVSDFDGDGDLDVVESAYYATPDYSNSKVSWYQNDGHGSFTEQVISTVDGWPLSVRSADLDGDGDLDVLAAQFQGADVLWYENLNDTPPTISTLSPADNATSVAVGANLVLTFNEGIRKGAGNIVLKRSADNLVVETIAVDSTAVTVSGATATIDPSVTLGDLTGYYVEIAPGAFEDVAGNEFGGFSGATAWNFTTAGSTAVSVAVAPASVAEDGSGNLVYTFTRTGEASGSLTVLFDVAGDAAFSIDYSQTGADGFADTAGSVVFAAGEATVTVVIDPAADTVLEWNETVVLTVAAGEGYAVGSPATASATIANDDPGVELRFAVDGIGAVTSGGTVSLPKNTTLTVTAEVYASPVPVGGYQANFAQADVGSDALRLRSWTPASAFLPADATLDTPADTFVSGGVLTSLAAPVVIGTFELTTPDVATTTSYELTLEAVTGNELTDTLITDAAGNSLPITQFGAITIEVIADATPPHVTGVAQNGGQTDPADLPKGPQPTNWASQRSDLRDLVVTFSEAVAVVRADDLVLTNLGLNPAVDSHVVVPLHDDQLSLSAGSTQLTIDLGTTSLPDGVYELQVLGTVTDTAGNLLDGDRNGSGGDAFVYSGSRTNQFYKLTGDWNGSGGVNIQDFATFAYWFQSTAPPAPAYVDVNRSGGINIQDFAGFAANFQKSVNLPTSGAEGEGGIEQLSGGSGSSLDLVPAAGRVSNENGQTVVNVAPGLVIPFSVQLVEASSEVQGFQLNFGQSHDDLQLTDWTTNAAGFPMLLDSELAGDLFVAAATVAGVSAPPAVEIGSFQVTAPVVPGDYGLTIHFTSGNELIDTMLTDPTGQALEVGDFGDAIIRVLGWHNAAMPCDVNDDGDVTPLDVLTVIAYLNAHPNQSTLPTSPPEAPHPYYDVNDDKLCTPLDVLLQIVYINRQLNNRGEGELASDESWAIPLDSHPAILLRSVPVPQTPSYSNPRWRSSEADHSVEDAIRTVSEEVVAERMHSSQRSAIRRSSGIFARPLANEDTSVQIEALNDALDEIWGDIIPDVDRIWNG